MAPRGIQGLFGAVALTVGLFAAAVGVAAGWPQGSALPQRTIPDDDVPAGVSETDVGGYAVVLVREGDDVVALSPAGFEGDQVVWCPNVQRFVSERSWAEYLPDGRKVAGPGESLARYEVMPRWDSVIVRVTGDSRVRTGERHARPDGHPSACRIG